MADKKISELVSLAGVDLSDADLVPVVDVSTAEAKAVSISGIKAAFAATFSSQAQTEIYTTEALGRAAVADGQAFKVQGSGDVAAYEYRRTNSTTSVLIATYPSVAAVATVKASVLQTSKEVVNSSSGTFKLLVNSSTPAVFSRGTATTGTGSYTAGIYGWKSPFKHTGVNFNAVRLTFGTHIASNNVVTVDILASDGVILATGSITATNGAVPSTYIVQLNRRVSELASGAIAYIRYYDAAGVLRLSAAAGGAYDVGDADPLVYKPQYFIGSEWLDGGSRIHFDLLDTTILTDSPIVTKNSSSKILSAFIPFVSWQHPDGDTEMDGDANYGAVGSVGFYEKLTDGCVVNAIQWRVWKGAASDVEYRIYVRDTTTAFNLDTTPIAASGTILAANMPTANAVLKISLADPLAIPAGKYLYVFFKAVNDGYMSIRRWSTNTANRHGFLFNAAPGWNNSFTSGGSTFNSTAPKLFLESEELRTMAASNTAAAISFNNALGGGFAATNVQAALQEIVSTDLVLPPSIFGVQGRECNVYFDNLLMDDASDYAISALAGVGVHQNERWTWNPAGAVTSGALTVGVYNKRTAGLIAQKSTNYLAAASTAGAGLTKKVLVLGDSLVSAGVITQTLLDISATDAMAVTLYGTQGTGANKHEGHGGYTTASFVSTFGPFYDGSTTNFSNYLTVNSIPVPDWVFISLGINDMSGQFPDAAVLSAITNSMGYLNTLITSIKAAGAGIKVGLMIPTPPSNSQDAFGANYGASQPERWRFKRSIVMYARQLLANYVGQESNRIYVVPVNTALDTVNNMVRYGGTPANSRTSATIARQGNGVHPDTSGYQQIGDALWAFLKCNA